MAASVPFSGAGRGGSLETEVSWLINTESHRSYSPTSARIIRHSGFASYFQAEPSVSQFQANSKPGRVESCRGTERTRCVAIPSSARSMRRLAGNDPLVRGAVTARYRGTPWCSCRGTTSYPSVLSAVVSVDRTDSCSVATIVGGTSMAGSRPSTCATKTKTKNQTSNLLAINSKPNSKSPLNRGLRLGYERPNRRVGAHSRVAPEPCEPEAERRCCCPCRGLLATVRLAAANRGEAHRGNRRGPHAATRVDVGATTSSP